MQGFPGVSRRPCIHQSFSLSGYGFSPGFQQTQKQRLVLYPSVQTVISRSGGDSDNVQKKLSSPPARGGSRGGGRGGGRGNGRGSFAGLRQPVRPGNQGPPSRGGSSGRGRGAMRNQPEPRVIANRMIQSEQVRLLAENKDMIGVRNLDEAIDLAVEQGLDVVLVSPDADPPVCRLMDASKHKYELEKRDKEAKKRQRESRQDVKELKVRPGTDVHDYEVRLKAAQKFLAKGDKVKFSLQFRGREMQFQEEGSKMFQRFMEDLKDKGTIENHPSLQGRTMYMIIGPPKI